MVEAAAAGLPIIADWEHATDFHGAWRASRNVFEMDRGLKDIWSQGFRRAARTRMEVDISEQVQIMRYLETYKNFPKKFAKKWNSDAPTEIKLPAYLDEEQEAKRKQKEWEEANKEEDEDEASEEV